MNMALLATLTHFQPLCLEIRGDCASARLRSARVRVAIVAPNGHLTRWPSGQEATSLAPEGGRILTTWSRECERMAPNRPGGAQRVATELPPWRCDLVGSRPPHKPSAGRWSQNDQGEACRWSGDGQLYRRGWSKCHYFQLRVRTSGNIATRQTLEGGRKTASHRAELGRQVGVRTGCSRGVEADVWTCGRVDVWC